MDKNAFIEGFESEWNRCKEANTSYFPTTMNIPTMKPSAQAMAPLPRPSLTSIGVGTRGLQQRPQGLTQPTRVGQQPARSQEVTAPGAAPAPRYNSNGFKVGFSLPSMQGVKDFAAAPMTTIGKGIANAGWNAIGGPGLMTGLKNMAVPVLGGITALGAASAMKNKVPGALAQGAQAFTPPAQVRGMKFSFEKKAMRPLLFTLQSRLVNDAITRNATPAPVATSGEKPVQFAFSDPELQEFYDTNPDAHKKLVNLLKING